MPSICKRILPLFKYNIHRHFSSNVVADSHPMSKELQNLIYRKHGNVTMIGINRPERKNALDKQTVEELIFMLDVFEKDEESTSCVLFGEGGNFSAGFDLIEASAGEEELPKHFLENRLTNKFYSKPLIAAINGYAVGAGFDLALICDIRLMEETAVVGCFSRRFGSCMSEASIIKLHEIAGFSRAMNIILTGKGVKGKEAVECGIASRLVPCGTALGEALGTAESISKFPQAALLADRAALYKCTKKLSNYQNFDYTVNTENIAKDIKKGAILFSRGAGRKGNRFSCNLWKTV